MIVTRRDDERARRILTAMIVNRSVLARVAAQWKEKGLFASSWSNALGGMCVRFFRQFDAAPEDNIIGLIRDWAEKHEDDKTGLQAMEEIVEGLANDFRAAGRTINVEHLIDVAQKFFTQVKLRSLGEGIVNSLNSGKLEEADQLQKEYERVSIVGACAVSPSDPEFFRAALEEKADPLIIPPMDFKEFFEDALERDGFVSFAGVEKRGKTFWLMTVLWWCVINRRRVYFFGAGDMTQNQVARRLAVRIARRTIKERRGVRIPCGVRQVDGRGIVDEWEHKDFLGELYEGEVLEKFWKVLHRRAKLVKDPIKIRCYPNATLSADGIRSALDEEEDFNDFVADVVIIDYADLLVPPKSRKDFRHEVDDLWKQLRRISEERHVLLVTATQANAKAYKIDPMTKECISEDKRKLGHITAIYGLNQKKEEKEMGVMRLNTIDAREGTHSVDDCIAAAGSLWLADPAMFACFRNEVTKKEVTHEEDD